MLLRKTLLTGLFGIMVGLTANAQLFETRSTRHSGAAILDSLQQLGTAEQIQIRDSILAERDSTLTANQSIETFFDNYHLGLILYQDRKPYDLIGFWDPEGNLVNGGTLVNGNGVIRTPFNPSLMQNFKSETVTYVNGIKEGAGFYYCDCASVLRKGNFKNNQKEGWWKEFKPNGEFIRQKRIKVEQEVKEISKPDDIKWIEPAHCMMRNPDEDIKCPKN